jgi:hypothetical protein
MAIEFDPQASRAAKEACAPDPVLHQAILDAIEITRRHWAVDGRLYRRAGLGEWIVVERADATPRGVRPPCAEE